MPTIFDRVKNGWNAFLNNKDPSFSDIGVSSNFRPDRIRLNHGNEKSIVTAIYNRIALDTAEVSIQHVRVDENENFVEEIFSELNSRLRLDPNIDQTGRAFIQDIVLSMFDEGSVAIVPVYTDKNPKETSSYDILSLRTAKITQWYPKHVKLLVYNEDVGRKEEIILPKSMVALIENPFYAVMNEGNSTVKRLIRKLALVDYVDEQTGAGKLDVIIQLPYVIKSEARKQQAETRRKELEMQLAGSKYGIGYTDGTERITQLNRPVENQLLQQVKDLRELLYSQLGITEEILNGSANADVMMNYYTRTIEPILAVICDEMKRKFLTKTARTQGQTIKYFRDPFKLMSVSEVSQIGDTLTRNEVLSSNEVRAILGYKPSDNPSADELRNKNMPIDDTGSIPEIQNESENSESLSEEEYNEKMKELEAYDKELDGLEGELNG